MSSGGSGWGFSLPSDPEELRRVAMKAFYGCWAAAVAYISLCVLNGGGSGLRLVTSGGISRGHCQRLLAGPCAECAREMADFDNLSKEEQDAVTQLEKLAEEEPPPPPPPEIPDAGADDSGTGGGKRKPRFGCSPKSDD